MSSGPAGAKHLKLCVVGGGFRAGVLRSLVARDYVLVERPEEADLVLVDMAGPDALARLRDTVGTGKKTVAVMDADEALDLGPAVLESGVVGVLYAPFRSEQLHALIRQIFLPEAVEAEVQDSFRALRVTVAHHVLNALTPIKLKSTSLLRRLRSGEVIPPGELEETLSRFLKAVERVEAFIRDLDAAHARDREVYHGREDMIRIPRRKPE